MQSWAFSLRGRLRDLGHDAHAAPSSHLCTYTLCGLILLSLSGTITSGRYGTLGVSESKGKGCSPVCTQESLLTAIRDRSNSGALSTRRVHTFVLNVRDLPDRLAIQRLRTLQEKKGAQAKAARRDIAMLLEKGKLETARIKVENSASQDSCVCLTLHVPG